MNLKDSYEEKYPPFKNLGTSLSRTLAAFPILVIICTMVVVFHSCSDYPMKLTQHEEELYETNEILTWQERLAVIATKAEERDRKTRWDTPWWDMSDGKLADSIAATESEALIGFKEADAIAGVDEWGKVLVSEETVQTAIDRVGDLGFEILHEFKFIPYILAEIPAEEAIIGKLRDMPYIDVVEPNARGNYFSSGVTWNVQRVQAPSVWTSTDGSGEKVLIIDAGVDENHTELNVNIYAGGDCVTNNPPFPAQDHGTKVAGVIAAQNHNIEVTGVSHGVELWSCQAGENTPTTSGVISGIEFARSEGIFVTNISLGGFNETSSLTDEIQGAYQDGLFIVGATGQDGGEVLYPATLNEVIAVNATKNNDQGWKNNPTGPEVELVAPGVSVETICFEDYNISCTDTGTSFAAPHVSGAAALLKAYNGSMTNDDIREALTETAKNLGPSDTYGYGLIQIEDALEYLKPVQVFISGPTTLDTNQMGTWTANVSNAFGAVTYQWYYTDTTTSSWIADGTNSYTYSRSFSEPSQSATDQGVRVVILADGEQDDDIQYVTVFDDECEDPTLPCNN